MTGRSKFHSLTLINWNGFFARTFDLDALVTTLSGGNGAGKSTTMAAFVTALIPDLTLLHFRNTTEAGATSGSRDKGLHGKLRAGICYSLLEVVNSRNEHVLVGVRLQQIAGRDRKVDLKLFCVQGITPTIQPIQLVTQQATEKQVRVLSLTELKEEVEKTAVGQFKQFTSITDYHSLMFDLGVIPKRLRSSADRSKFYRLIEASLYGGISSAITRSLRDYLLPENSGVRKAFQDMEAALRENRMTLAAIRVTQTDRDLFKHLIAEATAYVAADYMRHASERRQHLQAVLRLRMALFSGRGQLAEKQQLHTKILYELAQQKETESELESTWQAACDQFNLMQAAARQQEKIGRWQHELDALTEDLAEQNILLAEASELQAQSQERSDAFEQEVDEIKSQLADYQQALDAEQTRAIQHRQALDALAHAQALCQLEVLTADNAREWQLTFQEKEQQATQAMLVLEQKLSVADAACAQFEQAYRLVCQVAGTAVSRGEAWHCGREQIRDWPARVHQAKQIEFLRLRLSELEQRLCSQQDAQRLLQQFHKEHREHCGPEGLMQLQQELEAQESVLSLAVRETDERHMARLQELEQLKQHISQRSDQVPAWLAAQDALHQLREQTGHSLEDSAGISTCLQQLLENERTALLARDAMTTEKRHIDEQIERLGQPEGAQDARLPALAEHLGGVLLSEIYDDVTLDDAPYFSALYGPSRHGIVVPDLLQIKNQLVDLPDCPDDLWLIQGDPQSFDDSVFDAEEQGKGVLIKATARQWRYSRFPEVPLFGRAARDRQLEKLHADRNILAERYAALSFDIQRMQRLHQAVSRFMATHSVIVFDASPESAIRQLNSRHNEIERSLHTYAGQHRQQQQQLSHIHARIQMLNRLIPQISLLNEDNLPEVVENTRQELKQAQSAVDYLRQHDSALTQLEPLLALLQVDPQGHEQLKKDYLQAQQEQHRLGQQVFALTEVLQRRMHFSWTDAADMLQEETDLHHKLRQRLAQAEAERMREREQLRSHQLQYNACSQSLASLKSTLGAKQAMLKELQQELQDMGVPADANAEVRIKTHRDELHATLNAWRTQQHEREKQRILCEADMDSLQKKLHKLVADYQQMRAQAVDIRAGWYAMMHKAREGGVTHRLHRRELAYLSTDELRSMSDKALGSLRLAVADNEYLRDLLRLSENPRWPERRVEFYGAVYQHLRERIRQDIIHTDDPVDAIEQMEIELSRLAEELGTREQQLAISSKTVASLIHKTILREQNRIHMLNQGLSAVAFGQVKSVRLNVNVRDAHATLLKILSEQQEQHQDLFNSNRLSFSEAMARLYQRLNPQIDMGQRSLQTVGEELLDYRNYLELDVEVFRGAEGWLRAESGALSTGEAIGTGMSILVMVIQSWEEESRRLRGRDILPCRLLFLDEAARLDATSIATLFELCERLQMQLIIAAPENISPEKGTTYKLVRKVWNNHEHVHVVGLRGFISHAPVMAAAEEEPV